MPLNVQEWTLYMYMESLCIYRCPNSVYLGMLWIDNNCDIHLTIFRFNEVIHNCETYFCLRFSFFFLFRKCMISSFLFADCPLCSNKCHQQQRIWSANMKLQILFVAQRKSGIKHLKSIVQTVCCARDLLKYGYSNLN